MPTTHTATVPTPNASRYLQQLCKHWAHKLAVSFTPEQGNVRFPSGSELILAATAEDLCLTLHVPDGEDAENMRQVVQNHLDRFAHREAPLRYDWTSAV